MAVDERSRFELHQRLGEVLGEEHAVTLIEQLTTADQIRELEQRMDGQFQDVDERFSAFEQRMDERFQRVDERFAVLEQRMDERLVAFEQRMVDRLTASEERMGGKLSTSNALLRTEVVTLGSSLRKEMGRQTITTILGLVAANVGFAGIVLGLS